MSDVEIVKDTRTFRVRISRLTKWKTTGPYVEIFEVAADGHETPLHDSSMPLTRWSARWYARRWIKNYLADEEGPESWTVTMTRHE